MLSYAIQVEPDDGAILATSRDIPIVTFGADEAEALEHAKDAVLTVLEGLMDWQHDVPLPDHSELDPGPFVRLPLLIEMKVRLYAACRAAGVSRADLCRRLNVQRQMVDRLFYFDHNSRVDQLDAAFKALGAKVEMGVSVAA